RFGYGWLVLGFGFGEEFDEVVLPDGGLGVGAVAVGLVGDGDEDELRVRHFPGELFGDAELGRIDVVVGGVDVHDGDGDAAEVGLGVVVPRGVHVIDHVVRVDVRGGALEVVVDVLLGGGASGCGLLEHERSGAHDEEHLVGGADAVERLGGVVAVVPGGVALDVFDGHVAHHAVAAGDLGGEAGEGHERVGEAGVGFAPDEGLHAAHGG